MGFYTGRSGKIFLYDDGAIDPSPSAATAVLKIRDWSIETSLELLDTPGMVSSTGSATVMYYRKEGADVGVQFDALLSKIMKTSTIGVETTDRVGLSLRAGSQAGAGNDIKDDIAFNAYITSAGITVGTGELTSVPIQFTVDGPFLEIVNA
jgi:hypothetical protein